jgi:hypothetical protein
LAIERKFQNIRNSLTISTIVLTIGGRVETPEIEIQQKEVFGLPSPIFQINVISYITTI